AQRRDGVPPPRGQPRLRLPGVVGDRLEARRQPAAVVVDARGRRRTAAADERQRVERLAAPEQGEMQVRAGGETRSALLRYPLPGLDGVARADPDSTQRRGVAVVGLQAVAVRHEHADTGVAVTDVPADPTDETISRCEHPATRRAREVDAVVERTPAGTE